MTTITLNNCIIILLRGDGGGGGGGGIFVHILKIFLKNPGGQMQCNPVHSGVISVG